MHARNLLLIVLLLSFPLSAFATTSPDGLDAYDKADVTAALDAFHAGQRLSSAQVEMLRQAGFNFTRPQTDELDDSGGPDNFGHFWIDSNEPNGPDYNWIDITGIGTNIAVDMSDDDTAGPFDMGFTFPFYTGASDQVWVQSNGTLTFIDTYVTYTNTALPYDNFGTDDDALVAWFWDDFDVANGAAGDIYVAQTTVNDMAAWVCSYINVSHYPDSDTDLFTGQVILFENGEILINIDGYTGTFPNNSCTIGIQNSDLSDYLQVVYNATYVEPELAISMFLPDPNASLQGQVFDSVTGAPVEGADVYVGTWHMVTGPSGGYLFDNLYGGITYDVTVVGPNYYVYEGSVTIDEGPNTLNVEIDPFPQPYPGSYEDTFEGDGGLLVAEGDWEHGAPTWWPNGAHSGNHAWSTILDGMYNNSQDAWLHFDATFLVNSADAELHYWHWFNYSAVGDGYNVQISVDGTETWQVLQPNGGYNDLDGVPANGYQPCWNNSGLGSGAWTEVSYSLSQYEGQQIWLAFRHTTDEAGNWYSGVTIDDLIVNVGGPASPVYLDLIGQTVIVPPSGGTVVYDALLESTLPNPVPAQAWTMVTLPNGNQMGPLMVLPIMVVPGTSGFTGLTLNVPAAAPGGLYTYSAYIGQYPNVVAASDGFTFEKIGTVAGGSGDWSVSPWQEAAAQVAGVGSTLPVDYAISEAYPNPFNPTTTLELSLPSAAEVVVTVYNITGQQVATLANGRYPAGQHSLTFDARGLASGVYFVRAEVPGELNVMRKVMLVR